MAVRQMKHEGSPVRASKLKEAVRHSRIRENHTIIVLVPTYDQSMSVCTKRIALHPAGPQASPHAPSDLAALQRPSVACFNGVLCCGPQFAFRPDLLLYTKLPVIYL